MADAIALVVAGGLALMGAGALVRPALVLAQFGVEVGTADGRNEVRAVYGGFGLAVAALVVVAALGSPAAAEGIFLAVAFALVGMAAGRLVGAAIERPGGIYPVWVYFAVELVGAAGLLWAAWG